ncbi:N-acetylmuramic acid 6-phosphate etherase [Coccidioides posadasii str. Silveira]|uniref:N-acetylmuramic acid 6-phosphate etherase n=1 Tax=Coccidioides posadasii (strain RMSCC 757 / Silveira) TaxID=443226 RepID=E9DG79_COCPS|nr:N-acetylmuramic acid 6-phosphate etherase [Coccidioides posadasii str. Silveira]
MKAGTATKLVLKMLSIGVMIRSGETYGNIMVDLEASNLELEQRSLNIIRKLSASSCPSTDAELDARLACREGSVKLALAALALEITPEEARRRLEAANGCHAGVLTGRLKPGGITPHEKGPPLAISRGEIATLGRADGAVFLGRMAAASALAVTSIRSTLSALDALRMRRAPVQIPVESLSELDGLSKAALKLFNPTPSTNYDLLISVLAENDEKKLHGKFENCAGCKFSYWISVDLTSKRMKRMPFPQGLQRLCCAPLRSLLCKRF